MQDLSEQHHEINVVLVGDEASGKTEFFNLYCPSDIPTHQEYVSTIGAESRIIKPKSKGLLFNSGPRLIITDTSEQARFKKITQGYYHNANIVLYFVDASVELNEQYIEHVNAWLRDIISKTKVVGSVIVVLAKSDLVSEDEIKDKRKKLDDIITCWNKETKYSIQFSGSTISSITRFGIEDLIQNLEKTIPTLAKKIPTSPTIPAPFYKMQKNLIKTESFIKKYPILLSVLTGFSAAVILSAAGIFAPLGVSALGVIYFGILIGIFSFALSYQVKNAICSESTITDDTPDRMSHERMKPLFDVTPSNLNRANNLSIKTKKLREFDPSTRIHDFNNRSDDTQGDEYAPQWSLV